MPLFERRVTRSLSAALLGLALAATGCRATSVEVVTDEAVVQPVPMPEPAPMPPDGPHVDPPEGGAVQVEPREDIDNPSPVPWERVAFDRAKMELTVYWSSGVEPCTQLHRVNVDFFEDEVLVTVLEGSPPEAATMSCIAMAQAKQYTVALDEDPGSRPINDGATG